MLREEVEMCPHCMGENIIRWDVENDGYKIKCQHCGKEIMLCDACLHSGDNLSRLCDWCEESGCWRERSKGMNKMKVYVVERNNPECWEEPQVYTDGNKAIIDIRKEYEELMEELGTSQEIADAGDGNYGCDWKIDEKNFCGECQIEGDWDSDRWQWRITKHEILVER